MLSLYRRSIKLTLVSTEEESHGWATTLDEAGAEVRIYFKGDQARFMPHLKQDGVASLRLQLEKRYNVHPRSITLKRAFNTFTYQNLSFSVQRAKELSRARNPKQAA